VATNDIEVAITIDNKGLLKTDTFETEINGNWKVADRFTLPWNTKYVTIKADNLGGPGGILASFNNNVITNCSWECANMHGCHSTNCENHTNWHSAIEYGPNSASTKPWGGILRSKISEIAETAQWIWVNDTSASIVWCRKTF
ncbi:Hypothetical predicted protein, partial [Paramuricea clavata]